MTQPPHSSAQPPAAQAARHALLALRGEIGKAVVGQEAAITGLVIALLCRGHVLLEGVPGVAKTLLGPVSFGRVAVGFQACPVHP